MKQNKKWIRKKKTKIEIKKKDFIIGSRDEIRVVQG